MEPLHVAATLGGPLALAGGALALDGLLGAAVALRDRLPPPTVAVAQWGALPPLDLPLARSACGRLWLASHAYPAWDAHETRWKNRRFPVPEALRLSAMRRVDVAAGPQKSYRIPYATGHVAGDRLEWWCRGDASAVRALLGLLHHLGHRRGVGLGRVVGWDVRACDAWDGFPVLRAGRPLRPLPLDWPGLVDYTPCVATLEPPYWDRAREQVCAGPVVA